MDIKYIDGGLPELTTERLLFRRLTVDDISEKYYNWLNDTDITKFLEIRHIHQSFEMMKEYILFALNNTNSINHFGIFLKESNSHIGTITAHIQSTKYKLANISFVIGDKNVHGNGYCTESLHAVLWYLFTISKIHKVEGGHYRSASGSKRVFEKNGFIQEGILREHVLNADGQWEDLITHGLLSREFKYQKSLTGIEPGYGK